MGGQQSAPEQQSSQDASSAKTNKEPESFTEDLHQGVTSFQPYPRDSGQRSSADIHASWELPRSSSESRRSASSETSLSIPGSNRRSSSSSRSSYDNKARDSAFCYSERRQSFLKSLEEEPSEFRNFSNDSANQEDSPPKDSAPPQSSSVGLTLEQILPLYCQLTGKSFNQLTSEDTQIIIQLASNPQLLAQQLVQQAPPPEPAPPEPELSSEDQALLDAYQFADASQQQYDQHLNPEDEALLEAYQFAPQSNNDLFSQEDQALLDAYQFSSTTQDPFTNLSAEEKAILGDPQDSDSSSSITEEEIMEPPKQSFNPTSSSFFNQEIHPASVLNSRPSTSNRSSAARSSFAEEQRLVRPSMDIAGGQYTRFNGVQGTVMEPVPSESRGSECSSLYMQDGATDIPPPPPPPPPGDYPMALHNLTRPISEIEPTVFSAVDPNASLYGRMERLNLVRSSFAAERESGSSEMSGRSSGIFGNVADNGKINISTGDLASELQRRYNHLAVIPNDVPVPMTLLCMLWGIMQPVSMSDAQAAASVMESKKILRTARLEDGSLWCMVNNYHANKLKENLAAELPQMHSRLINLYRQGFNDLSLIPDDHYIMQNVSYHLTESGRLSEMAALLGDAVWLETKLRSYGTGSVVADFRRFFNYAEDQDLNLMLRAFQISAVGSLDHSTLYVLKEQMVGRLIVASRTHPGIRNWYDQAIRECRLAVPYRKSKGMPIHLLPKTPSLVQAGGLQRLILKGHCGAINKVQLSPNGLEVVTASADGSTRVWDMEIGDFVLKMDDHKGPVTSFALSDDGRLLVSGGEDGVAIVYDLPSGVWKHKLTGHTKRINVVAIDPQCQRAVTSSQDMTTRIWCLSKGTCLHVLSEISVPTGRTWEEWAGHHDIAISPDSRIVATVDGQFRVRLWTLENAFLTDTLEGHSDWVVKLNFAGDSGILLTASHDKTLRLWDLWKGCCDHVFEGHRGRINNLAVTEDGSKAVSVSDDAIGIVWDIRKRSKVCELHGHVAWINDAAITPDGSKVVTVSADELGIVWDGVTGEALRILKGHSGEVSGVSLSFKGRFAITASADSTARVWDLTAPSTHVEDFHNGRVSKILYYPGHRNVVTIGEDRVILIWDLEELRATTLIRSSTQINFAFLVAEGTRLVTASGDRCLCVWDLENGNCIKKLPPHSGSRVKSIAVSQDGSEAVIVLFDSTVTLWNLETMELTRSLMRRAERDGVSVHAAAVNEVVMTGGRQAVTVSKDHTGRLWNLDSISTSLILSGHEDGVDLVSVKEDGSMCMTAGYDRTARLWDLQSGECTMVLDHPKDIDFLVVSSTWTRAVTIAGEDTAWLWDIAKGRCLGILESQGDHLAGAVFSPDGQFLATYSTNSVLRLWTSNSGKLRAVYLGDTGITSCQFVGGREIDTVVIGDGNGHVHFLEFPSKELTSIRRKKNKD